MYIYDNVAFDITFFDNENHLLPYTSTLESSLFVDNKEYIEYLDNPVMEENPFSLESIDKSIMVNDLLIIQKTFFYNKSILTQTPYFRFLFW